MVLPPLATFTVRESPSGPIKTLTVPQPTPTTPASGTPLRVAQDAIAFADIDILNNAPVAIPVTAALNDPDPTHLYVAEVDFDVRYYGGLLGAPGNVLANLNVSPDAAPAALWLQEAYYSIEEAADFATMHVHFATKPTLGSALGLIPGSTSLAFTLEAFAPGGLLGQAFVVSSANDATRGGACCMKLTEYQP